MRDLLIQLFRHRYVKVAWWSLLFLMPLVEASKPRSIARFASWFLFVGFTCFVLAEYRFEKVRRKSALDVKNDEEVDARE